MGGSSGCGEFTGGHGRGRGRVGRSGAERPREDAVVKPESPALDHCSQPKERFGFWFPGLTLF